MQPVYNMQAAFLPICSPCTLINPRQPIISCNQSKLSNTFAPVNPLTSKKSIAQQFRVSQTHTTNPTRFQPICFNTSDDGSDEGDGEPSVVLVDPNTERTLTVGVEHTIDYSGERYIVCYPMDDPVSFAYTTDDESELEAVDDPVKVQALFPNAEAVLAEENIELKNTAFVLTIDDQSEYLDDDDDGDINSHEIQDQFDVEIIAAFSSKGEHFSVVRALEPVLLIAKEVDHGTYKVLEGTELDTITPIIEEYVEDVDLQHG